MSRLHQRCRGSLVRKGLGLMQVATSMASRPRQPAQGQNVSEKNQGTELDALPWLLKEIISA
ncbi:MAG: hypothetical protein LUP91_08915, partial [Methylococcaceae bacterium]|nr:hypothetical protein [Methylococcaceae bacterium]